MVNKIFMCAYVLFIILVINVYIQYYYSHNKYMDDVKKGEHTYIVKKDIKKENSKTNTHLILLGDKNVESKVVCIMVDEDVYIKDDFELGNEFKLDVHKFKGFLNKSNGIYSLCYR